MTNRPEASTDVQTPGLDVQSSPPPLGAGRLDDPCRSARSGVVAAPLERVDLLGGVR
jgi:hypothetical protein